MESKPHTGLLTRLTMLVVMIAATLTMSAQTLRIQPAISSNKATPVINNTLNALQGSGSISFTLDLIANVSEISEATLTIDGESHDISYTIDEQGDRAIFSPYTLSFDRVATYSNIEARVVFRPSSETSELEPRTVTANYDNSVRIWSTPSISFDGPSPDWGLMSGGNAALGVQATGGYSDGWRYSWSTNATTPTINYTATNTDNAPRRDQVTVRVTNMAPDGASVWTEENHTFNVQVFSPANADLIITGGNNALFAGETASFYVQATGGNPDTWNYSWNGVSSSDGSRATYTAVNNGTTSVKQNITATVTNTSPSGDSWFNRNLNATVTVWPTASATLIAPERTEWYSNETIPFSVQTQGGDASKWTYAWTVDGQPVANTASTYNYTATSSGNFATRTISVTATNTPDGINKPQVITQSYTCTVYPQPYVQSINYDKNVVYSDQPVTISITLLGGKPNEWTYEWTSSETGSEILGTDLELTTTPIITGTSSRTTTVTYKLVAKNNCGGNIYSRETTVPINVWPEPTLTLKAPERTEWFDGETVELSAVTTGGDPKHWIYYWTIDDNVVPGNNSVYNYIAKNSSPEGTRHTITLSVINNPEDMNVNDYFKKTLSYECIVYATPAITGLTADKSVVYSGTEIQMNATVSGGNPDGWRYEWTIDNSAAVDFKGLSLNDTPVNNGSSSITKTYGFKAINTCGGKEEIITRDITVTVWPTPAASLESPERTEWINGESVPLSVSTTGGDAANWTYTWSVDGTTVSESNSTYNYLAFNNSPTGVKRVITVTATNAPQGIDQPYTRSYTYECIVYGTPEIATHTIDKPVTYSGTNVTIAATVAGGYPDGWTYSWTADGIAMSGSEPTITVAPANTGTQAAHHTYRLTAVNTCNATVNTLTQDFEITVWPVASATIVKPENTEWYSGATIELDMNTAGGDSDKWTYSWSYPGSTASSKSLSFNPVNTGNAAVNQTVTVTATNTPDGIDAPYTVTYTYDYTLFPEPKISEATINRPVIFSGDNYTMSITAAGGNPDGWTYSWTRNGTAIANTTASLSEAPVNMGTTADHYTYVVTASNTCESETVTLTHTFETSVWPAATANLSTPSRVEWLNGETLPFAVSTSGGDDSKWTYSWTVDGQVIAETSSQFNYIANNTGMSGVRRTITVTATNSPEGITTPYTYSQTYSCTVYPTPVISATTIDKTVTYNGTPVTMGITTQGGAPQGWVYSWTKNGNPVNGTTTLTDVPTNTGTGSMTSTYEVTAVNTLDDQVNTFNESFTVTVWPTPSATLADNLPEDVISGDVITLPVTIDGGDMNAWNIKWSVDGTEVQNSASTTFDFTAINTNENDAVAKVVTVEITNAPEGIDQEFSATYSHTFTVWPGPTAISILDNFQVTCARRSLTLGVKSIGGQSSNWAFEWTHNGSPVANTDATLPVTFVNPGSTMLTETYTVTSTNTVEGEVRYRNTETFTINVYPEPKTTQGRSMWEAYYGNAITLEVATAGGYPQGWKYEWSEGLPDASTVSYTIPSNSADSYSKTVTLTVTNGYEDVVWSTTTYTYDITCWSKGDITKATNLDADYNGNINTTLNAIPAGGYANGWTYVWYLNGEIQSDGRPSLEINETNYTETVVTHNWVLRAENTLEGVVGCSKEIAFTYNLWPVIEAPTSFDVSHANVSNGSTIVLSVSPQAASGGYQYTWNYNWTANGTPISANGPVITVTASISNDNAMAYDDIVYGLRLTNPAPDGGFWFDETYANRTVRVYNRPSTPTSLERKGNGTTCTLIALTDMTDAQLAANDYMFVFGYTDASGVDHAMPSTADRFCRFTSDVYNNSSNDFWVYARWSYSNGVTVTSNRRHLNGSIDDYDGSNYDANGRGDSAGFDNIVVDDDDIYVDARGFKVNLTTAAEATVRIINTAGNVVFMNKYPASDSFSEKFDKATLLPGVYIVTVEAGTSVKIKKIVIK